MARKLRPLGPDHLGALPCDCVGCVFWESADRLERRCGAACDEEMLRDWYRTVNEQWGECGRVAWEDDQVLGFIKYAPPLYFPQAQTFAAGPPDPEAVLLACLHIRDDARQHGLGTLLLRAALRDLSNRGVRQVEAYAAARRPNMSVTPVVGMEFLLRNGFTVSRPHPDYPLLRLDLRSLATLTENIEAALQALRIPLRTKRVPTPSIEIRGSVRDER